MHLALLSHRIGLQGLATRILLHAAVLRRQQQLHGDRFDLRLLSSARARCSVASAASCSSSSTQCMSFIYGISPEQPCRFSVPLLSAATQLARNLRARLRVAQSSRLCSFARPRRVLFKKYSFGADLGTRLSCPLQILIFCSVPLCMMVLATFDYSISPRRAPLT